MDRPVSERQPSVAFSWLYTAWGGAEIQLLLLARHAPAELDITVIAPQRTDGTLRALWSSVPHRWVDLDHHVDVAPLPLRRSTALATRLRRAVRTLAAGADLVRAAAQLPAHVPLHLDVPPWSTFLALQLLARRRPIVLMWHTPLPDLPRVRGAHVRAKLRLLGRSRGLAVVAASESARDDAIERFGPRAAGHAIVAAGYDPDEIAAASVAAERPDLVVGVGALVERKGVDVAIDAIGPVRAARPGVRLTWCGDGDLRAALERRVEDAALTDVVELRRPTRTANHRIDLLRTVAGAAVYVQPSRIEGLPVAVIEAMALGRPVVATRVGAMGELGDEAGVTWIPVDDPDALAAAVIDLLGDPERRQRLGLLARRFVERRFDMSVHAARWFADSISGTTQRGGADR